MLLSLSRVGLYISTDGSWLWHTFQAFGPSTTSLFPWWIMCGCRNWELFRSGSGWLSALVTNISLRMTHKYSIWSLLRYYESVLQPAFLSLNSFWSTSLSVPFYFSAVELYPRHIDSPCRVFHSNRPFHLEALDNSICRLQRLSNLISRRTWPTTRRLILFILSDPNSSLSQLVWCWPSFASLSTTRYDLQAPDRQF